MFSSNKFKANIVKQGVFHTQTIVSVTLHRLSVADGARADELTSYMFKVDKPTAEPPFLVYVLSGCMKK